MPARVISSHVIHAWLASGFFVIQYPIDQHEKLLAAITCRRKPNTTLWIASDKGTLRRLNLVELPHPNIIVLPLGFFLQEYLDQLSPQCDGSQLLHLGDITCVAISSPLVLSDSQSCDCVLEICATEGYAMVGYHDCVLKESFLWDSPTDAVSIVSNISEGPIRDAIVPPGFVLPAIITVNISGLVRATSAPDFFTACKQQQWKMGQKDVVNMLQPPIMYMMDSAKLFMVLLGAFRAGIVLYSNSNGKLASSRFLLKGGAVPLSSFSVVVREESEGWLMFEELASGQRTSVSYHSETSSIDINLDFVSRRPFQKSYVEEEDQETTFRSLLRGIEELGLRESGYDVDSRKIEAQISSYNSALLFVMQWKEKKTRQTATSMLSHSCTIQIDNVAVGNSPRFHLPSAVAGKETLLTVSFRNSTGIALCEGWMLRLRIKSDNKVQTKEANGNQIPRVSTLCAGNNRKSMLRELTAPLPVVTPGSSESVSFPIVTASHSTVYISVSLHFQHPTPPDNNENLDIEVDLLQRYPLDVLCISRKILKANEHDKSHDHLEHSHIMQYFDKSLVEKRRGHALVSRMDVPFPQEVIQKSLGITGQSMNFESILGAQFTISISEVVHLENTQTERPVASNVTIRGVAHVIPFVRAAILGRLLECAFKVRPIMVRGSASIETWQRALGDSTDECLPSFRSAETRFVEALRRFSAMEEGERIQECYDGQERDLLLEASQSARIAYGTWRRQCEHLWTPFGSVSH